MKGHACLGCPHGIEKDREVAAFARATNPSIFGWLDECKGLFPVRYGLLSIKVLDV